MIFARGSTKISGASEPTLGIDPRPVALQALKRAREHRRGLAVKADLTFDPSSGSPPISHERSILVRLA
jgi:hypothetical protein